jgi:hypothetical protein
MGVEEGAVGEQIGVGGRLRRNLRAHEKTGRIRETLACDGCKGLFRNLEGTRGEQQCMGRMQEMQQPREIHGDKGNSA